MNSSELNRSPGAPLQVNLVLTGAGQVTWQLGDTLPVTLISGPPCRKAAILQATSADALLFWDPVLGQPDEAQVLKALAGPSDLWHAGLCLGMGGLPVLVDFVQPTWMFNCDPSPEIEATSWRVSLRTCLVRTEVLRKMGFLRPEFSTLEVAALEWGHRLLARGVLMRHVPSLLAANFQPSTFNLQLTTKLPFSDELRFIHYRYGRKWAGWALFRAVMTHYTSFGTALRAWRSVMSTPRPPEPPPFRALVTSSQSSVVSRASSVHRPPSTGSLPSTVHRPPSPGSLPSTVHRLPSTVLSPPRVSVLIPTVDRYPYLRTLLDQLRRQTVPPCEIIIVDQTTPRQRDVSLAKDFPDLPLKIINQDVAGQCASRNAGLQTMTGDCVLFIDDDDEVDTDLIERHLDTLAQFDADSSSGIADEVGAEDVKPATGMLRSSDQFPTNNTLAKRTTLEKSGLFDLAYNRGQRADGDLGMRVYLSGARMVLNTDISVLHHHAPSGGLRKHKARVVTYASSRRRLLHRNLPSATEFYLGRRYFSKAQVRAAVWLRVLGTFSARGGSFRKANKILLSAILLPHTLWVIRKRWKQAAAMLREFPKIPHLSPQPRSSKRNGQRSANPDAHNACD